MNKDLRETIIAGNWKMNKTAAETGEFLTELVPLVNKACCSIVVCVPFTDMHTAAKILAGTAISLGAQNCHWAQNGAFTGEISADMLKEQGVTHVIIGHSERRQYFGETDETVNLRIKAVLTAGLKVILCVGETLEQRESQKTCEIVKEQLVKGLLDIDQINDLIIAYEPVWAIGTGRTATAQQADETITYIRSVLAEIFTPEKAERISILYGGSMNAGNAEELLSKHSIDGGLIGGASLDADAFSSIVSIASR